MTSTQSSLLGLCVALGCGLLIGIEREQRKGSGPTRSYAGVRSFALAAMLGQGRACSIKQALAFALILTAATGALAGLAEVHAASGSVLSLAGSGVISPREALFAVLLALSTNTLSKLVAAALSGGAAFATRVGLGLAIILLAAWTPYWWSFL